MDSLIGILVLIGIFAASSSKKKKKKAQKKPVRATQRAPKPEQAKIPFTRDEWQAFLKDMRVEGAPAPKPPQRQPEAVEASSPAAHMRHDEPEGTVSTQGESAAEHAEHRAKILAEEAQRMEQHETLQELRRMNLEKLRSAVVMSEVLDKPVSLRRRNFR